MNISVTVKFKPIPDLEEVLEGFHLEAANIINEQIIELMHEPKSGRIYQSRKTGRQHQASASGEAPAVDSGELSASFKIEDLGDLSAELFSEVRYGGILEDSRNRPFSEPAIEKALPEIIKRLEARVETAYAE